MTTLTEWESFYVIVGSSAGALIGLVPASKRLSSKFRTVFTHLCA